MEPILRTEHLTFTYPGEEHPSLGDLSLEIARGSFVAILGHNGSGKSTLAKLFNAILLPTGGKVYVDGMDTADENNLLSRARHGGHGLSNPDNQIVATSSRTMWPSHPRTSACRRRKYAHGWMQP